MAVLLAIQEVCKARVSVVDKALTNCLAYPQVIAELGQDLWQIPIINATLQSRLSFLQVVLVWQQHTMTYPERYALLIALQMAAVWARCSQDSALHMWLSASCFGGRSTL